MFVAKDRITIAGSRGSVGSLDKKILVSIAIGIAKVDETRAKLIQILGSIEGQPAGEISKILIGAQFVWVLTNAISAKICVLNPGGSIVRLIEMLAGVDQIDRAGTAGAGGTDSQDVLRVAVGAVSESEAGTKVCRSAGIPAIRTVEGCRGVAWIQRAWGEPTGCIKEVDTADSRGLDGGVVVCTRLGDRFGLQFLERLHVGAFFVGEIALLLAGVVADHIRQGLVISTVACDVNIHTFVNCLLGGQHHFDQCALAVGCRGILLPASS